MEVREYDRSADTILPGPFPIGKEREYAFGRCVDIIAFSSFFTSDCDSCDFSFCLARGISFRSSWVTCH